MVHSFAKAVIAVFGFLFLIVVGLSIAGSNWLTNVDPNGSLQQSPFFYAILLVTMLALIGILRVLQSNNTMEKTFSLGAFVNVVLSGIVAGGIVHELVHVLLLAHPTQFRIHFGDANAIFSTCCLLQGEQAQEIIAYAVQFLITAVWVLYFFKVCYPRNSSQEGPKNRGENNVGVKFQSEKYSPSETKFSRSRERVLDDAYLSTLPSRLARLKVHSHSEKRRTPSRPRGVF